MGGQSLSGRHFLSFNKPTTAARVRLITLIRPTEQQQQQGTAPDRWPRKRCSVGGPDRDHAQYTSSNDALAAVVWMKARDYRSEEQSPWFQGLANGSLYLEDFLAGPNLSRTFVTPYISSPAGRKGNESGYHSVDGDDGIIDEFGRFGGSYEMGGTSAPDGAIVNFRFDFSRNNDAELPRSVGLVVTNAFMNTFRPTGNTSVATIFDSAGGRIAEWVIDDMPLSIIQSSLEWRPYYTNGAQLVGVVSDVGIASFTITGVN